MITRIALLEGNEGVRLALTRVLRRRGYDAHTFSKSNRFLNYFYKTVSLIDLCIIDCDLLDINLHTLINGRADNVKTRLILTTASANRALELGLAYANMAVLVKPFGVVELLETIGRVEVS